MSERGSVVPRAGSHKPGVAQVRLVGPPDVVDLARMAFTPGQQELASVVVAFQDFGLQTLPISRVNGVIQR